MSKQQECREWLLNRNFTIQQAIADLNDFIYDSDLEGSQLQKIVEVLQHTNWDLEDYIVENYKEEKYNG